MREMTLEAVDNALKRLYPKFPTADHAGWAKVYEKARKGAPDALKCVGDEGEPGKNPVCKAILGFIAGGKKGAEIREHFESSPFGWSRDAVDGGVQALLIAGLIQARDERGRPIESRSLARKSAGKASFKVEAATVTTVQRIRIRKLLQKAGLSAKQGEEPDHAPRFIETLMELAARAGGDAPLPERPDVETLEEIRLTAGNERLLLLYNRREELSRSIAAWTDLAARIEKRRPAWVALKRLVSHAEGVDGAGPLLAQAGNIERQRQLLEEPDLIDPLAARLAQLLREELNRLDKAYAAEHEKGMARLKSDESWGQLDPEQRNGLLAERRLTLPDAPEINVASAEEIIATLERMTLAALADRVAAMPSRFTSVLIAAAELMEPEAQFVRVQRRMLKTEDDIEAWVREMRETLKTALDKGPIVIQ